MTEKRYNGDLARLKSLLNQLMPDNLNSITAQLNLVLGNIFLKIPGGHVMNNWRSGKSKVPEWIFYVLEHEIKKTKQDQDNVVDKINALQSTLSEMSKELTRIKSHYHGGSVKNQDGGDDEDAKRLRGVFDAYNITQDTYTNSKGELRYIAHQIPVSEYRGAWVEFEVFLNNVISHNYTDVPITMIPDILNAFEAENLDFDDPEREKAQNDRVAWCKAHKIPPLMF